jgi:O-antigen/teichoic acid export membrane protein
VSSSDLPPTPPEPVDEVALHGRILRSSGWVGLSLAGKQLASFLSLLVLARVLEPGAFGVVSLAWTVLAFVEQLQDSGVGSALVFRRKDVREAAGVAVIWAPVASLVLYAGTFALAPLAAHLLHSRELTDVLRVMALVLVFRGLSVVPSALLERELDFRARTRSDVAAAFAQIAVSIPLAFAGAGVWSLVAGVLAAAAVQTALLWTLLPWRPRPAPNRLLLKELLRYGRFVGMGNILGVIDNTVDNLAVARMLGTTALGYYGVAFRLADFPNSVLGYVVSRVMFPVYAILQNDVPALRRAYVQTLQRIAIVAFPVAIGIIVAARPIVLALLGEKWLAAIGPLRILGAYGCLKSLISPSNEVFKGIGRPGFGPMFSVPHLALAVPVLYFAIKAFGLNGAALGILILMAVVGLPAFFVAMRLVGLGPAELTRALAIPALCAGCLAAALGILLRFTTSMAPGIALLVLVVAGGAVYAATGATFGKPILTPMWASLRATRS